MITRTIAAVDRDIVLPRGGYVLTSNICYPFCSRRHHRLDTRGATPRSAHVFRESRSIRLAAIATNSSIICGQESASAASAAKKPQNDALVEATEDDTIPAADRATALMLRVEGEALYKAEDDDECEEKLEEALEILSDG